MIVDKVEFKYNVLSISIRFKDTFIFLYLLNCISQSFEQNSKDCELLFEQLLQIFSE